VRGGTAPINLAVTPSTAVWGYFSAKAKPVPTIHSRDVCGHMIPLTQSTKPVNSGKYVPLL
jgi:hypothetical protein